ncbi:MAG: hypothetical protein AABY68_02265 [Pseudomonadota bacterium]
MITGRRCSGLAVLCLLAAPAQAHSFGKLYTLPVPFWLYGWASAAALLLSFLVLAWFFSQPGARQTTPAVAPIYRDFPRGLLLLLKSLALLALLLCIAAGFLGTQDAYRNINMTLFWIVFVLGMTYATVLVGDVFALANPWRAWAGGRYAYPRWLGHWPALLLYVGFVWSELFADYSPQSLAAILLGYTLLNLLAAWLFGARDWFHYGEFFSVMFRLLGKMAPLAYRDASETDASDVPGWRWRWPGAGLLASRPSSLSEVLFILFMLSSTAFDGFHATQAWALVFWQDIFALLSPWLGSNIVTAYATLKPLYVLYQTVALLLSPLLYLAIFATFLWLMKHITASALSLDELICRFSYSLLPIVVVYHFTHYFTLLLGQGSQILHLLSDPLGAGWNLLALDAATPTGLLLNMAWVWHIQVAAILLGHIASVVVAHEMARRLFPTPSAVWRSQLPLLILMMAFTVFGLWILALPLSTEVLR